MPRRQEWPPKQVAEDLERKEFRRKAPSLLISLHRRELGLHTPFLINNNRLDGADTKHRIDGEFNSIAKSISELQVAINNENWEEIEHCVSGMLSRLLDNPYAEPYYHIPPQRKQERETFVALGGLQLLMQLLEPPMTGTTDARQISPSLMLNRAELWNEVMTFLKELVFAIPNLAESFFSTPHLAFLFTMLGHQCVFESTMSLLEDVLAVKSETFDLSKVPNLYALLDKFSSRQLMYFCRLLALVLFESEDRQIMECTQVLRSLDLLQLRRDRMAKMTNTVERNQCLILQMPRMLEKLTLLLRIVNHGPPLSKLVRHNIPQTPTDVLQYVPTTWSGGSCRKEWELYEHLDDISRKHEQERSNDKSSPSRNGHSSAAMSADEQEDENVSDQLLSVFSPPREMASTMMSHILNIMQAAANLGIATISHTEHNHLGIPLAFRRIPRPHYTYRDAKNDLQFQAMLLVPQQVELLFVLCTLLSGRRKVEVQRRLAELGLIHSLHVMHDRLSWGAEPYTGHNPMEHIHGPGCDCNPESAIRVQFLRLVHNFYDRDFIDNPIKDLLLSNTEIEIIKNHPDRWLSSSVPHHSRGLLSKITATLINEPYDSIYRFWLMSCLEAFLRGSNKDHQVFIAHSGVIRHVVSHVISIGVKTSNNLQTAFDLLGELTKFNLHLLEFLEDAFQEQEFRDFMDTVLTNLVDSNVFLRSLYLSMEFISGMERSDAHVHGNDSNTGTAMLRRLDDFTYRTEAETKNVSYLTHSWVQCHPQIISSKAMDAVSSNECDGKQDLRRGRKGSTSKVPTSPVSPHPSNSNPSSSSPLAYLGQGVFNAFKGLHRAAIGFVNDSEKLNPNNDKNNGGNVYLQTLVNKTPILLSSSRIAGNNDQEMTEVDTFGISTGRINGKGDDNEDLKTSSPNKDSVVDDASNLRSLSTPPSPTAAGWCLPDSIFRISLFLSKERENVLLRLMGTISIHTINHENICCLNTALVIFILAYQRGQLSSLLENSRILSKRRHIPAPALENENVSSEFPADEVLVFSNFRKLLWYWREYYLRRGRDRLSLEFSSHLPFKLWNTVVELLCADDGSPTSLLSRQIKLPVSPYRRLARPPTCTSEFILNMNRSTLTKKSVPLDGID